jgi:putative SOS response-associated peptidase YedK
MESIHDRMPVILASRAWDAWLGAENASTEALKALLVPASAEGMVAYPVSTAVNRASVEGDTLIAPMEDKQVQAG